MALVVFVASGCAAFVKDVFNPVRQSPPYQVDCETAELHESLVVADLHADSLLWNLNVLQTGHGHIDVDRLRRGNVAIQVFGIVTEVPVPLLGIDSINVLAWVEGWPPAARRSPKERALRQAAALRAAALASPHLRLIRTRRDLAALLEHRLRHPDDRVVGALLAIEGGQCLEGQLDAVDEFFEAGVRMFSLTHRVDNDLGGSSEGSKGGGLTPFGRDVLKRISDRGIIVDLAHASPDLCREVLCATKAPVVVSHTGVTTVHHHDRNITPEQVRQVAERGGVIGVGFWDVATGGNDVESIAETIDAVAVAADGLDHVGLGSDFDGFVTTPFDVSGLALLTQALRGLRSSRDPSQRKYQDDEIRKIMGGNVVRFLLEALPH